jgi:hypothetical protein
MKIVKRVGERLPPWLTAALRPILTVHGAGTSLIEGSRILLRRGWHLLGEHFDGPQRYAALAAGGYAVVYAASHARHLPPFLVPGAVVIWCAAAWWHAPSALAEPEPIVEASAPTDAFVPWLLDLMGDRPGIHLRELYPAMRQLPGHADRDNTELRAALNTLGIPVTRSLRLGHVAGRSGVARSALEALPSPAGESSGETDGDAGQTADSPAGEQPVEQVESA